MKREDWKITSGRLRERVHQFQFQPSSPLASPDLRTSGEATSEGLGRPGGKKSWNWNWSTSDLSLPRVIFQILPIHPCMKHIPIQKSVQIIWHDIKWNQPSSYNKVASISFTLKSFKLRFQDKPHFYIAEIEPNTSNILKVCMDIIKTMPFWRFWINFTIYWCLKCQKKKF